MRSYFWSVFSRIWTKYREILRTSPYSVRMRENTDQKKLCVWTLFTQYIFKIIVKDVTSVVVISHDSKSELQADPDLPVQY